MSLNDYDFTAEMQAGRDLAQRARNRGQSARTRGKWAKAPPAADTPENRLCAELADLRRDLRDKENTIAVLRQNGGSEPDDFGSEFDRLFTAAKREGPGLPAEPQITVPHSHASEDTRGKTMTKKDTTEKDDAKRDAALRLLADGIATPSEVARLAGVSRQLVNHWASGMNWRKARNSHLSKAWREELR